MKHLLKQLKAYRKESILGPLFKLLEAGFELLVPLLSFVSMGALIGSDLILLGVESIVFFIGNCKYRNW